MAAETDQLRIGAVIDRDFRTDEQVSKLEAEAGVHVLGCHEIENFFVHPGGLRGLLAQADRPPAEAAQVLREEADRSAGRWIYDQAAMRHGWDNVDRDVREAARLLGWAEIGADISEQMRAVADKHTSGTDVDRTRLKVGLVQAANEYARLRTGEDLWKHCYGKEALQAIPRRLGLSSSEALEARVLKLWDDGLATRPAELEATRAYIESIAVIP